MDIDQMEAGPELKELIAEKVMGWKSAIWRGVKVWKRPGFVLGRELPRTTAELPDWPTEIGAAWEVVEKMTAGEWGMVLTIGENDTTVECRFHRRREPCIFVTRAPTAQLTICRAALKAALTKEAHT